MYYNIFLENVQLTALCESRSRVSRVPAELQYPKWEILGDFVFTAKIVLEMISGWTPGGYLGFLGCSIRWYQKKFGYPGRTGFWYSGLPVRFTDF